MRVVAWSLFALLWLGCATCSLGQLVATRDLTQPPLSGPTSSQLGHYDEDYKIACNGSGGADGVNLGGAAEDHLEFSIVDAKPEAHDAHSRIIVTVRLKNLNVYAPAEIPWEFSPVVPVQIDPRDKTLHYEAVDITVFAKTPKRPSAVDILPGRTNLWAQPGNPAHYLKLKPGEWIELKIPVSVNCDPVHESVCSTYLSGNAVQLTSRWYQRELTHVRKGCVVTDGAFTTRELESAPFDYEYAAPTSETPTTAKPPKSAAAVSPSGHPIGAERSKQ
jgi:hypothetical protein